MRWRTLPLLLQMVGENKLPVTRQAQSEQKDSRHNYPQLTESACQEGWRLRQQSCSLETVLFRHDLELEQLSSGCSKTSISDTLSREPTGSGHSGSISNSLRLRSANIDQHSVAWNSIHGQDQTPIPVSLQISRQTHIHLIQTGHASAIRSGIFDRHGDSADRTSHVGER
jgi:hypothetical protein